LEQVDLGRHADDAELGAVGLLETRKLSVMDTCAGAGAERERSHLPPTSETAM